MTALRLVRQPEAPPAPPPWASHYDRLRWALYVVRNGCDVSRPMAEVCQAMVEHELAQRQTHKGHPLRWVELWRPECRTCSDVTWPRASDGRLLNPAGKPCGRTGPGDDVPHHGVAMQHLGGDRHRCPRCGVEEERTSQLEMVRRFLHSSALYFVALGGNRSSKSWSGSVCAVMTAMGAAHPDVVEVLRRNGLSPGRLPQAPALVLAGSITNDDSRDYLRPIYDSLLPADWQWSARFAAQTASTWQPGSGAGLPGIPLAIALPEARFVLLEPRSKRVSFLQSAVRACFTWNIEIVRGDVAALAAARGRKFQAAVSRATFPPEELPRQALALLVPGGHLFAHTAANFRPDGPEPGYRTPPAIHSYRRPGDGRTSQVVHWQRRNEKTQPTDSSVKSGN